MQPPIRVLLVASPLSLQIVQQMLRATTDIAICGTARQNREALSLLPTLAPDVICLAHQMGGLSSLELTREIMSQHTCPILVLKTLSALEQIHGAATASSALPAHDVKPDARHDDGIFALLQAGAVDAFFLSNIVPGPDSPQTRQLIAKIKMVARVPVISRSNRGAAAPIPAPKDAASSVPTAGFPIVERRAAPRLISLPGAASTASTSSIASAAPNSTRIVAIGASTGGPQALLAVLSELPANYGLPILCVQHISKGFLSGLIEWLDAQCRIKVKIARSGEIPAPGTAYFPEEDRHLELDEDGKIKLSLSPAVDGHRASATTLFQSVAQVCGSRAIAVLLTGMGADGARGLRAVHEAHGVTFAQNQESCVVFGMPAAAIEMGAAQHVLSPPSIAARLVGLGRAVN